jgi:hypothetical protein
MLYVIPGTLLKVLLNTNKTGNDTFNNVSGIRYNMVTSFIGGGNRNTCFKKNEKGQF